MKKREIQLENKKMYGRLQKAYDTMAEMNHQMWILQMKNADLQMKLNDISNPSESKVCLNNFVVELTEAGKRQALVFDVIEAFEDFLEEKGIDIPNPDKEESNCPAIIYGYDYAVLEDRIREIIDSHKE